MSDDELLQQVKQMCVWSALMRKRAQCEGSQSQNPREFTITKAACDVVAWPVPQRTEDWVFDQWVVFYAACAWIYSPELYPTFTKELIHAARTEAQRRTAVGR